MYYYPQANDYLFMTPASPKSKAPNLQLSRMESPYDLNPWNNIQGFEKGHNSPKSSLLKPIPPENNRINIPSLSLGRQNSVNDLSYRGTPTGSLKEIPMHSARMLSPLLEPTTPRSSSNLSPPFSPTFQNSHPYYSPNLYNSKSTIKLPSIHSPERSIAELPHKQLKKIARPDFIFKDQLQTRKELVNSVVGLIREENQDRTRSMRIEEKLALGQLESANLKLELARNSYLDKYNEQKKPKRKPRKLKEISDNLLLNIVNKVFANDEKNTSGKSKRIKKVPISLRNIEENSNSEEEESERDLTNLSVATNLSRD